MSEHTDSQLLQYASLYIYFILTKSGSWLIATFQMEYIYPSEMSKHCCPHTVATTALRVARNCPMGISHRHTAMHCHTHTNTPVNIYRALVCQQMYPPLITSIYTSPPPLPPRPPNPHAEPPPVLWPARDSN